MIYQEFEKEYKSINSINIKAIREEVMKGMADFVGTQTQIDAEIDRRAKVVDNRFKEARQKTSKRVSGIMERFKEALCLEYGTHCKAVDNAIYDAAYAQGHSAGFHDIEVYYQDFSTVAHVAYEAGKKGIK